MESPLSLFLIDYHFAFLTLLTRLMILLNNVGRRVWIAIKIKL